MSFDNPFEASPAAKGDCGCGQNALSPVDSLGSSVEDLPPVEEMQAALEELDASPNFSASSDEIDLDEALSVLHGDSDLVAAAGGASAGIKLQYLIDLIARHRGLKISISYEPCGEPSASPDVPGGPGVKARAGAPGEFFDDLPIF